MFGAVWGDVDVGGGVPFWVEVVGVVVVAVVFQVFQGGVLASGGVEIAVVDCCWGGGDGQGRDLCGFCLGLIDG